jgi:hypothetical protein
MRGRDRNLERPIPKLSIEGVMADDVLPRVTLAGFTERVHTLVAPASGDLDVRFERQDGAEGYTGPVYLPRGRRRLPDGHPHQSFLTRP